MKEIRVGIIGTGMISHQHMERYKNVKNVKVVACCDIDDQKRKEWMAKYDVEHGYQDFRELLARDDIDAVDVCLHNNLHAPMSIAAMKAGKNVYCEKPMAGSYTDAKRMYEAAKKLGRELAIHLDFIFTPQSRIAHEMVKSGELGHMYHARSVGHRRRMRPGLDVTGPGLFSTDFITKQWAGHGALYDMGVYHISQILYILGVPELLRVSGTVYSEQTKGRRALPEGLAFEVEELGMGFAKYEGGLTFDIIESWAIHMDELGDSYVVGSEGGLRLCGKPGENFSGLMHMGLTHGQTSSAYISMDENEWLNRTSNPLLHLSTEDQSHWAAYLGGALQERYDSAWLALQTMKVSEGIFLSSELQREVTADEIEAMSASLAVTQQELPFGTVQYDMSV